MRDKAFTTVSDPKYYGYQKGLASMAYKFLDKKSSGSGSANEPNYQLANELYKPIIRKFKKRKVNSSFGDNIWGVALADMQSLSKYNKGNKYLLCAINLFSKYACVVPLKDEKGPSIVIVFQIIISEGRKPNKIWVDQGSKFFNNSFKNFLKINNIEMYATYNEGKSVVAERFIRTLKNKIFKHMTDISKSVYFDVLDDIVNKHNNTVHKTFKMKATDVTDDSYAEYNEDFNKKILNLKLVTMLEFQNTKIIFAKGYVPNWSEKVFVVNKIKNAVSRTYVVSDLKGEEIIGSFHEKELQKTSQEDLE